MGQKDTSSLRAMNGAKKRQKNIPTLNKCWNFNFAWLNIQRITVSPHNIVHVRYSATPENILIVHIWGLFSNHEHTFTLSVHSTAPTEKQVKDIHRWSKASTPAAAGASFLYGLLTSAVVQLSLLGVGQHLIRLRDLFELQGETFEHIYGSAVLVCNKILIPSLPQQDFCQGDILRPACDRPFSVHRASRWVWHQACRKNLFPWPCLTWKKSWKKIAYETYLKYKVFNWIPVVSNIWDLYNECNNVAKKRHVDILIKEMMKHRVSSDPLHINPRWFLCLPWTNQ